MATELNLLSEVSFRDQEITGPRLRGLLALLAGDLRSGCSTARLVDGLWPDERPENPTKALQILVSRARGQLGPDVIARTATGYRLCLSEDQIDSSAVLLRASASTRHSRAGDHALALAQAEAGLAMWNGAPGDTADDNPVSALRAGRAAAYRSLVRSRALALSRLGRHSEAVEPLTELTRDLPRDEEVLLELLNCEAATVGPAAALARYEAYRGSLRDELGTDPGAAVQAVYHQLLRGESPTVRHGVPHEPNPLLGRGDDVTAVAGMLRTSRVTSIVGPGGLGKTRLAYVVSRQAEQRTVHLVALAGVTTDDGVANEVASALGVGESRTNPVGHLAVAADAVTGIVKALGPGPVLLVLDNCEQVIGGVAELVRTLVATTRDLRVLTTSRTPLGLSSEAVYLLPELSLPTTVELFEHRARAVRSGVDLPADVVEGLCRHLDGLPLAVELAAARVRAMSVVEIARHLDDRFALLRGGPRDAPLRHHTLHAVVDWSWNLLEPAEQAAMRTLSVFPGGFTGGAARHLLGDRDAPQVLEHLVDQSLLKVIDTPSGARFRMLETVREFSAARLDEAGETERATDGFLTWARDFGLAHHASLVGANSFSAAGRIRAEQDNLVQALQYGLGRADGPTVAATSAVLAGLWTLDASYPRIVALTDDTAWLLSHFRPAPEFVEVTRTVATLCTANMFMIQGPRAVRALVTLRRLPAPSPSTLTGAMAIILGSIRDIGSGRSGLQALRDSDEPLVAGIAEVVATYAHERVGDQVGALNAARRVIEAFEKGGTPWLRILAHSRVGELCLQAEQGDEARRHLAAALRLLEESGPWSDVIQIQWSLVLANLQVGDVDEAERWLELAARDGIDDAYGIRAFEFGIRAEVRLCRDDVDAGLRLWRRAVDQMAATPDPLFEVESTGLAPWALEVQAVALVAHAQHGRLDLVTKLADDLPRELSTMLTNPAVKPPAFVMESPICGTLLLALAMVDLDRGRRANNPQVTASGVQMIALAERFGFQREFAPTMSSGRARRAAEQADRAAYVEASSSYAALGRDDLRAAALSALRARGRN